MVWPPFRRRTPRALGPASPHHSAGPPTLIDQRGIPSHACVSCGGNVLIVRAVFEDYELAAWFLEAECACCGAPMTAPCPADDPTLNPSS